MLTVKAQAQAGIFGLGFYYCKMSSTAKTRVPQQIAVNKQCAPLTVFSTPSPRTNKVLANSFGRFSFNKIFVINNKSILNQNLLPIIWQRFLSK